jgi:hypothetical protein
MREILFRGKSQYTGEWVEGYFSMEVGRIPYIQWLEYDDNFHEEVVEECAVILDTVGQYTGLKDKNGKWIFEGDIVQFNNEIFVIEYYEDFAAYTPKSPCNMRQAPPITSITTQSFEVIGNIYDNPELLEGKGLKNDDR